MTSYTPLNLQYGQKLLIAYTYLDGTERAQVVEMQWLKRIARKKKTRLVFKKKFPFIGIQCIEYTDVVLNVGSDFLPEWRHLFALESPRLMAKKFGIEYSDINVDRIDNDLGNL